MKRYLLIIAFCLLTVFGVEAQPLRTCRYWYDRDIGNAITTSFNGNIGQLQLNVNALAEGLHTLHLQVADTSLNWGATKSFLFMKPEDYGLENLSYRCWFDYDIENQQSGFFGNGSLVLDVTNLNYGMHTLHLQLEGSAMTSTKSYLFLKPENFGLENLSYRCWFDYNVENQQSGSFESGSLLLDVSNLNDGIHTLHFQLVGSTMVSTKSYIFMKVPTYSGELQYRCWFDEDDSTVLTGQVNSGVFMLDVTALSIGQHDLIIQLFNGNLSSPRRYSFYRGPAVLVSANPVEGGTAAVQLVDSICTITATANEGYAFENWTENGNPISTNASHSFTITEDDRTIVANFNFVGVSYTVNAAANPVEGGTVEGTGTYTEGSTCTLTATPNEGYSFVNWTENGNQVSANASYSFTVSSNRNLMANFVANAVDYMISALTYPSNGGTVTGAGSYSEGSTCTLTAIANEGYTFKNWIENGVIVSTNAIYSFIVSGDRNLVAHFDGVGNHWTPESASYSEVMTMNSIIQIDGEEQYSDMLEVGVFCGNECRGSAIAAEFPLMNRYLAILTVYGEVGHQLTFKLYDHETGQELNLISPAAVTFTENGYGTPIDPYILNFISTVAITATVDPENAGMVTGTGNYAIGATCTLTATANSGYQFLNWTLNGVEVSSNASYQFTVSGEAAYVAHFQYCQNQNLSSGWNWFSTYIEQEGINGLEMLENSLGSSGIRIQGRTGNVDYFEYQGTSYWYGPLEVIENEQMYKIRTNAACNVMIIGDEAQLSDHPIPINRGWNWVGFPSGQTLSLDMAMSGFTPEANDIIKGRSGIATYVSYGNNHLWYGTLTELEPGQGYMYKSNCGTAKTLVFQNGRGEEAIVNVTERDQTTHWTPESSNYSDVMPMYAVIQINGIEQYSDQLEVGVFCGDECRGSVISSEFSVTHRYLAVLTVYGQSGHQLTFKLYDHSTNQELDYLISPSAITFNEDGYGNPIEPYVLNFSGEPSAITQTIQLSQGWNWFSANVEITLDDLKAALVEALPNTNITIKSKDNGMVTYNGSIWRGQLTALDVTQMYRISVSTACEITLSGMPINPANHPITIHNGANWIAFPFSESMTVNDAFAGFAVSGDVIKSKENGIATYNGSQWRGTLNTLVPGQGYIYKSNASQSRTFTFPTSAK